jgi:hypothetical protein
MAIPEQVGDTLQIYKMQLYLISFSITRYKKAIFAFGTLRRFPVGAGNDEIKPFGSIYE